MNTTNVFKDRGTQYVEDFSDSEDAWEHALSCDPRVIAALHGMSDDERAEAADEFGEGFMEAAYPKTPTPSAAVDAEEQLAASAFTGDDGYDWLTNGADDAYLAALNEEGVKAYVTEYGDIIWGGDAHLPRFEALTVGEFIAASDYDAAVDAVTEAVQAAKERTKESKTDAEKQREFELAATVLRGDEDHEYDKYLASFDNEDIKAYVRKYIEAAGYDAAVTIVTEAVQAAKERMKERKMDGEKTITAQSLYDWRQATGAVSGTELHLFFAAVCGYLTPAGNDLISIERIEEIARGNYVRSEEWQHIANNCCTLESETARIVLAALAALSKPKFLSGTVQVEVDLKNPPLLEGGIPAPRTWCQVLTDDTNGGRGYDVDYTPFSSLGWIFNAANVRRAEKNGTYATRGAAWLASEAFNTSEAARQRHLQG